MELDKDMTFGELAESLNKIENIEKLPYEIRFIKSLDPDSFIERGMIGYLTDACEYEDTITQLYFYFDNHHFTFNLPFFKEVYYDEIYSREVSAIDPLCPDIFQYRDRLKVLVNNNDKLGDYLSFLSEKDNKIKCNGDD